MGFLETGGVFIRDKFLRPEKDCCSDLGIGVADIERRSRPFEILFIFSFCLTPKRCSSSITTRPRFLNLILLDNNAWVPIIISISPELSLLYILFFSLVVLSLFKNSMFCGKEEKRFLKEQYSCKERMVVGARITTCFSYETTKEALIAISVFPKPTSPQRSRFIGFSDLKSLYISPHVDF